MKKILSILALILVLAFVFASCKNDENAKNDVTTPEATQVTSSTTLEETTPEPPKEPFPTSHGLAYEVNEDGVTCTITGIGTCTDGDVYIGGYIDGYKVITIKKRAFKDCSNLTSVTIGDFVTTVDRYAFENCTNLTSATLGNSVTTIGLDAFKDCSNLTTVTMGNSVTTIGSRAFQVIAVQKHFAVGWTARIAPAVR